MKFLFKSNITIFLGMTCLVFTILSPSPTRAENRLPLGVRDCLVLALENNLEISIQRLNPRFDDTDILSASGKFDPSLVVQPTYSEEASPSLGRIPSRSRSLSMAAGVEGTLPTGTTYDVGLDTSDDRSNSTAFRETHTSYWGATLTQPLLKGFGPANQLSTLRIARKQKEISQEAITEKIIDIITRIKTAYFNLYSALENQKVQFQSLDLAARLLANNRARVEIGVMAPLEVIQAEAGVAQREADVIQGSQVVHERMNELRSLISREISNIRDSRIEPLDPPSESKTLPRSFEESVHRAMEYRPDYRQALLTVEKRNLEIKFNQNDSLPQVDLEGSYGYNGLDTDFPKSFGTDHQKWDIGLAVRIPLPGREDRAKLQSSVLEKEKSLLELKQVEQKILVEVENAMHRLQADFNRIHATQTAARAAEDALNAEMSRMKAGTSDSFKVLELQKKLSEAKTSRIQALADYNISKALLEKAEGSSLLENGIELTD